MTGFSFLPAARENPDSIVTILKMLKGNIQRGLTCPLPEVMSNSMEKILSLDAKKDGEKILAIYDDFFDGFIEYNIDFPM